MKKSKVILATVTMTIFSIAVAVVSCKKESAPADLGQGKSTLARIKEFKRQLEAIEADPYEKTITFMSIDDAVWNIEALFNYTYAHPNLVYGQTVCCDTILFLPVCTNDSVSLTDLYVFNCQMYEAVLTLYHAAVLDNKQFLILDVEAGLRSGNMQAVELHTVQGSVKGGTQPPEPIPELLWGPFAQDVSWFYGENGGNSQGMYWHEKDAADTLTGMLNHDLVPTAPENHEYIYTQIRMKQTEGDDHYDNPYPGFPNVSPRFCEFYKENPSSEDYWLDSDQLNYYYFGEKHLVLSILPYYNNPPVPSGHSLFQVIVEDYKTYNGYSTLTIGHHTKAYYGDRGMIAHDSIHLLDL